MGRQKPFTSRSAESANVSAGIVIHRNRTGIFATPKEMAMGPSWATAMSPPVATRVIMKYISQKWGVEAISPELNETAICRLFTISEPLLLHVLGSHSCGGDLRNMAAMTITTPWRMPHLMNAVWYPWLAMMLAIGATVNAEPAPNPAAVRPAARPR